MKRQRSHYKLSAIKAAFSQPAQLNRTMTATHGAESMDMDEQAVADVISSLSSRDFDKSMRADLNPMIWQDVYKPIVKGRELYVKFTLDAHGKLFLISFKENEA